MQPYRPPNQITETMQTSITVTKAQANEQDLITNLYQLYQYDSSAFTNAPIGKNGLYPVTRYLADYWLEDTRHPYLCRVDNTPAGFALVRQLEPKCIPGPPPHADAEIMPTTCVVAHAV